MCLSETSTAQNTMSQINHTTHSHAHEEGIPGTVDLRVQEGEESHYGQALYPVPSSDPNDPLQVRKASFDC